MTEYQIIESTEADCEILDKNIVEFNRRNVRFTQSADFIPLNFHIKNEQDQIIAGINAIMYCWRVIYIDVLFINENYRNKSLGSILLKHIENYGKSQNASLIHLDTFDWQAKDFYLKHGFEIFGILEDAPPGHKRYYMKKAVK
jgi:N-acetylglutamate synthase-like GNAT family acetyltransferase